MLPNSTASGVLVLITSFGYGHSPAPDADVTLDARRNLRNPHHDPAMRQLTGLDPIVRQHVLDTPGAWPLICHTASTARALAALASPERPVTIATGCVGGRHRSVALAEEIGQALRAQNIAVRIEHRDITKPVIQK